MARPPSEGLAIVLDALKAAQVRTVICESHGAMFESAMRGEESTPESP
jgi:hypothetical protein